ncbi:MAG: FkbM family methyltransferase [Synergistaceae bacterium]|nr:FkbM family methyltransferase [Synergistaceae bacterium]
MIGKKKFYPFFRNLYSTAITGMNIGLGTGVNVSGEINSLAYVKEHSSTGKTIIIFDVGANKGQYSQFLLDFFSDDNIEIHSFEPGHETFKILYANLGSESKITLNNFGLSDSKSQSTLFYDKAGSGLASIYKRQLDYLNIEFEQSESIMLDTLDKYVNDKKIGHIDLLKLDVEGNELNVLKGAADSLANGIIKAIQIEFGGCNIDSRTFIRDFWNLLHKDFTMYRIMKDGLIEINQYDERLEIFTCTNFFFAKK